MLKNCRYYSKSAPAKPKQALLVEHWELLPLAVAGAVGTFLVVGHCVNAVKNYDYSFQKQPPLFYETQDLNTPYSTKYIVINQVYEPNPEKQAMLERIRKEEKLRDLRSRYPECMV